MGNISDNDFHISHPFVHCFIDGVSVRALVDTGSMKSFINHNIHRITSFHNTSLDKSNEQQYVSITGDNLNILGQISTNVKFSNSKVTYSSDFLVSNNIQYECVLGWDFVNRNGLAITRAARECYLLVGCHGKTPIRDNLESTTANPVGVTNTHEQYSLTDRLCQSTFQNDVIVALIESARIPP